MQLHFLAGTLEINHGSCNIAKMFGSSIEESDEESLIASSNNKEITDTDISTSKTQ